MLESLNDSLRTRDAARRRNYCRLVRGQGKWDLTDVPACESHSVALVPGVWLREEGGEGREGEARGVVISRQELWRLQKRIVSFPPSSSSSSSWRTTLRTLRVSSRVHERATFRSTRGGGGERGGQRFLARVLSTGRAFNESSFQRYPAGRKNAMFHTAAPVCRHPFLRGWKSSFSRPVDERTSPEIVYTGQIRGGSYSSIRAGIGFFFLLILRRILNSFQCTMWNFSIFENFSSRELDSFKRVNFHRF